MEIDDIKKLINYDNFYTVASEHAVNDINNSLCNKISNLASDINKFKYKNFLELYLLCVISAFMINITNNIFVFAISFIIFILSVMTIITIVSIIYLTNNSNTIIQIELFELLTVLKSLNNLNASEAKMHNINSIHERTNNIEQQEIIKFIKMTKYMRNRLLINNNDM